jgi:hypothetical protein
MNNDMYARWVVVLAVAVVGAVLVGFAVAFGSSH